MWSRRRLIQIISDAEPANSADSVQTLLKGYKAAIRGTTGGPSIFRTPRIVLGLSGFFDEENGYENSHNEHQNPHGPCRKRQPHGFVSSHSVCGGCSNYLLWRNAINLLSISPHEIPPWTIRRLSTMRGRGEERSRRFLRIVAISCHSAGPTESSTAVGVVRAFATHRITSHSDLFSSCHRARW
jgi:hypothetical protein